MNSPKQKKLFVWDFHGVLEKDNDLGVLEICNQVLSRTSHPERFTAEDIRRFYGLKWYQYFEQLLPHLSLAEHLELQDACFQFGDENPDICGNHIKPTDHSHLVLAEIDRAGHDQIIISNTRPANLIWFIEAVGIEKHFPREKQFGVSSHEGHGTKKHALETYLQKNSFNDTVIVGDSIGDMDLKEVSGGTTYFFNHPHLAEKNGIVADYYISDLRKLLQEL